jgi:tetratricopeptide (TPR) repeat protein
MRLSSLCEGNDRKAILSDVKNALKFIKNSRTGEDSLISLLSMRAKIEHLDGNDDAAVADLDGAIHANLDQAEEFVNSGGVAPEQKASLCTWTAPDMDALVQRFPLDYRAYLFRGLYYGFFVEWDEGSLKPSIENLVRASEIKSSSALPQFFMAHIRNRPIKRLGLPDAQRQRLNELVLNELTAALAIDSGLLAALRDRAETYFELKKYKQAIVDYDRIISLDPADAGAYNDRGLAKMQLGRTYEAISDFSDAIRNKKRQLQESSSYENRADAYIKTQQWELAIEDLTTAISLQTGGIVLLSNIKQFRGLYPEYKAAPDDAVARKLNQTFYPNIKYEDFAKGFLHHNEAQVSTIIPDLYLKRSEAYVKAGNWRKAAVEFRRAIDGFPSYADAADRWQQIGPQRDSHVYVDMKTLNEARSDSATLWIKQTRGTEGDDKPHSVEQYELNCGSRQIRRLSAASYDASGNVIGSHEGGDWATVVPDSLGETLLDGMCGSK